MLGLKSNVKALTDLEKFALNAPLTDPYLPNRIIAASLVSELADAPAPRKILLDAIQSNDDDLSNLAIQQIMYQPNAASFLPEIKGFYEQQKKMGKKKLFNANRSAEMMLYVYEGRPVREEEE